MDKILELRTNIEMLPGSVMGRLLSTYDYTIMILTIMFRIFVFQSKVVRAKERIDQELRLEQNVQGEEKHKGQEKG